MRQHKLALCAPDFSEWICQQTERSIHKYHMFSLDEKILIAVSGGKDSLVLWDVLNRLGYQADGLYINLGIDAGIAYSENSQTFAAEFAQQRNLKLITVSVAENYGQTLPEVARHTVRGRVKPCSICGLTKRYLMNKIANDGEYAVLATGHNLDDEVAVLFNNTVNWLAGYLARQAPVLEASAGGFCRKVKPFCRLQERETAAYAIINNIEYMYDECPFSDGATSIYHKQILNQLEADRPGFKQSFYISFLKAKQDGLFNPDLKSTHPPMEYCERCGQPTAVPGTCSFCRTWTSDESSD